MEMHGNFEEFPIHIALFGFNDPFGKHRLPGNS